MALALDATTFGQRFTVLCVSVLVNGCAIAVAWKVLAYKQKGSWQPYWQALHKQLDGVIPADWRVLVLADRGLSAPWLSRQIVAQDWHPFLRINVGAKACLKGSDRWEWLAHWMPTVGQQWAGRVDCFAEKANRLECTLLICQEPGYAQAWVIVTDLRPEQVQAAWYRLRTWIEGGFKEVKRGQWGWQHTKMLDPERAARAGHRHALGSGGGQSGGARASGCAPGPLATLACGTADDWQRHERATGARTELCHARTLAPGGGGLGGGAVAHRGIVA